MFIENVGKTSLCKAFAQKIYIRYKNMNSQINSGIFLEINTFSLFSKYFSESSKLIIKLFDYIFELAEDENLFICILFDEIESLVTSRSKNCIKTGSNAKVGSNSDPNDAIRAVNAVLTSIDKLKKYSNILILCTSNMVDGIDQVSFYAQVVL